MQTTKVKIDSAFRLSIDTDGIVHYAAWIEFKEVNAGNVGYYRYCTARIDDGRPDTKRMKEKRVWTREELGTAVVTCLACLAFDVE